jgi:hypothetical protein
MKMEPIEGSETSAISNQTPGKHPKQNILHIKHGESLKSRTAQHVSGILMPIIRSSITAVAASGLPLERGVSSAVGRGRAGRPARPRPTTQLPPRSNGKPEAATAVISS